MNPLLRTIISSTWSIDSAYAESMNPLIQRMFSGEKISLENLKSTNGEVELINADYLGKSIAVLCIEDVLMREDWCGEMGTESLDNKLKELAGNPSIGAVVLKFNTPGGQSEYIENVAKTIETYSKPIVSFISGSCASAGYWLAAKSNAIFTSAKTDRVGSIGVMISYIKANPESEDQPRYIQVNVYASRSIDKNRDYEEMQKGEHDRVIKNVLDPMNAVFLEDVQIGRANIDETALSGQMYYSQKAIELGLIDGIKSFDQTIAYVTDLIKNPQNQNTMGLFSRNKNQNQTKMKNQKFSDILGRDVMQGEVLSVEDLAIVQSHIEGLEHLAPVTSTTETSEEITSESISAMIEKAVSSSLAPFNEKVSSLENQFSDFKKSPGATATITTPVSQESADDFSEKPWEDPSRSYNKLASKIS